MEGLKRDYWSVHLRRIGWLVAAVYWIVDSYLYSYNPEIKGFVHAVFSPTWNEAAMRFLITVWVIGSSYWIQYEMRKRKIAEIELTRALIDYKEQYKKLKLAEGELSYNLDSLKLFAYTVIHDLKSPSVAVHGIARLLYQKYSEILGEEGAKFCKVIMKTTEQLVELTDSINIYIQTREQPLNITEVKIQEVCQTLNDEFATRLKLRRVEWIGPVTNILIKADRVAIQRVLRNLMENSLKYGGDELSEIVVGYEDAHEHHLLYVSDDGKGIKPEHIETIFEPFQRTSESQNIPGSGLGLAIVKEIAEKHGGTVQIESGSGMERGVTFIVSIAKDL